MAVITEILDKLLERTNQDKVIWKSTVDERAYITVIGKNSVVIQPDDRLYGIEMRVLDEQGREIDRLQFGGASSALVQTQLSDLFYKARNLALGVGSQLDKMLQELEVDSYLTC